MEPWVFGTFAFTTGTMLVSLLIVSTAFRHVREAGKRQDRLIAAYAGRPGNAMWFRVRWASEARYRSILKLLPWEHSGLLIIREREVLLVSEDAFGRHRELVLPRATPTAWHGRTLLNGAPWVRLAAPSGALYLNADTGLAAGESQRATWDIYQRLRGGSVGPVPATGAMGENAFALERNPHTMAMMALIGLAMLYALVDFLVNTERYAVPVPLPLMIGGGVAAAVLAGLWLHSRKIPVVEAIGVSAILGVVTAIAFYPGLLRVNSITGDGAPLPYTYTVAENGALQPPHAEWAVITPIRAPEYWEQFDSGAQYTVMVRQGGLGFAQYDLSPIRAEARRFYLERRARKGGD